MTVERPDPYGDTEWKHELNIPYPTAAQIIESQRTVSNYTFMTHLLLFFLKCLETFGTACRLYNTIRSDA